MSADTDVTYTISSFPPLSSGALIVGVEDDVDGSVKVYLGARYKRLYLRVTDTETKRSFRSAWGGVGGHRWLSPSPSPDMLEQDPAEDTA